jgi:hypothetical protein
LVYKPVFDLQAWRNADMSENDWKDWYRDSIREWKEGYRKQLHKWKEEFKDWKHQARTDLAEGSVPPMPPMPHIIPMPSLPLMPGVRSNVVASRIGDEELKTIDMLIEAGLFETRSEAVAYMVNEGMKARKDVVNKVTSALEDIRKLRIETDEQIASLRRDIGITEAEEAKEAEAEEVRGRFCTKCGKSLKELPSDISVCPYCGTKLK